MKPATIKDVALLSGVGIGTVSRVLNNSPQISEETRKKVQKAIEELNYVPNVVGKHLSQNRTYIFAIVVPVVHHPYFSKLIEKFEIACDKKGYSVLVVSSQSRIEKEKEILKRLRQNQADGALFVTHYEHDEKEFKNLAIVSVDRHLGKDIPIVTTNNYEATRKGVEYLIEKGCKRIAFLGSKPSQASEVSLREKAYIDVMKEHNLEPLVYNQAISHGEEDLLIDGLFEKYPGFDGVFVSGCVLAYMLKSRIYAKKLSIPKDVQIVSYDGLFSPDHMNHYTTLEQPLDEMAERSVELLIKLIEDNNDFEKMNKFDCRFIKGETTK